MLIWLSVHDFGLRGAQALGFGLQIVPADFLETGGSVHAAREIKPHVLPMMR